MSGKALGWALNQPVPMSSAKFVLAVMADQTTSDLVFMAVETLAKNTSQDRKTVIANLARLVEWGLIEDTGERRGRTGQIPVYRLRMGEGLFDNAPFVEKEASRKRNSSENGTVPKTDSKSPVFPSKDSQKRDTDRKLIEADPSLSQGTDAEEEIEPPPPDPSTALTDAGAACLAMRRAGMPHTNPSHPKLLAALAAGVTSNELADVVREYASAHGGAPPGLAYACTTALNRRAEAARETAHANPSETSKRDRPAGRQSLADSAAERAQRIFSGPD